MADGNFVVRPPKTVTIPVLGTDSVFPVRRVYCVGRNYSEHIREMGGDERQPPFFFQKPADAVVGDGARIPYPSITSDFQYEIELVMAVGESGINITPANASDLIFGLAAGIDLTRRDVQVEARKAGRPWEIGKAFDNSAPVGVIHPTRGSELPVGGGISLSVNGEVRQSDDLSSMIWNCAEIVSQLSRQYLLEPGDLIFTGTPAGVGPLVSGDVVEGHIEGLTPLTISII